MSSGIKHITEADCEQPTVARVQEALREKANATPAGEWVRGFKYDDTKTPERRFLTRQDLDAVSVNHPIYVSHRAGHVYGVNSKALEMAGITRDTPDPSGGRYGRDPASGELDGVVYERAWDVFPGPVSAANYVTGPARRPAPHQLNAYPGGLDQRSRCKGNQ